MSGKKGEGGGQQSGSTKLAIDVLKILLIAWDTTFDTFLSSIDFLLSRLEKWARPVTRILALVAKSSFYILVVYLLWLAITDVSDLLFLFILLSDFELDGMTSLVALSIVLAWRIPGVLETFFQSKNGSVESSEAGHKQEPQQ